MQLRSLAVTVPTKSIQIGVRFKAGVLAQLTRLAAKDGLRRAEWMRKAVLRRAEQALSDHVLVPLPIATAGGEGEGVQLRLTSENLKIVVRAAKKEGVLLSTYVRVVCMLELASALYIARHTETSISR